MIFTTCIFATLGRPVFRYAYSGIAQAKRSVIISDRCVERLKKIASPNEYLRVIVDSGGCAGYEYKFNLVDTVNSEEDHLFEKDGAKVIVDDLSLSFMDGATIDYHEEMIRSTFRVVKNPNADTGCSCGASFSVKEDL
ncbi:Iron-sulfur cluster assembly 2 -like protein, mitochondrial [Trichinella pseudospiralis]|uniref:Iron-sulfur cluster assembly 2 homolog, mitochondrial n=1 Tax=Trichinella pseudospiralis TaxID=6337 RepID=A0A0V1FE02_TRIPS|nr:Iron-sulfur cluster assembly 2 -like protein, mitochondrial [Trichinella pseudospiralis]